MAKRGGFPGGGMPGNMANLMKQAQRMQRQMEENQKELETKEFTAKAGGGAVEVTVTGKKEITKVKLSEEVVDPDDIEMLEENLSYVKKQYKAAKTKQEKKQLKMQIVEKEEDIKIAKVKLKQQKEMQQFLTPI